MTIIVAAAAALIMTGSQTRPVQGDLAPGDKALDFTLKFLHSKETFRLSSNFGTTPTVLIFGSYT